MAQRDTEKSLLSVPPFTSVFSVFVLRSACFLARQEEGEDGAVAFGVVAGPQPETALVAFDDAGGDP